MSQFTRNFLEIINVQHSVEIQRVHSDGSHQQVTLYKSILTIDSKNLGQTCSGNTVQPTPGTFVRFMVFDD